MKALIGLGLIAVAVKLGRISRPLEGTRELYERLTHDDQLTAKRILPPGTWMVHFTNGTVFRAFDRGATLRTGLHLTNWNRDADKPRATCPENLSLPDDKRVLGFAFAVPSPHDAKANRMLGYRQRKYGKGFVLFRSDAAIEVFHTGDDEHQAVFPICSEYDVSVGYDTDMIDGVDAEGFAVHRSFQTFGDMVKFIEARHDRS